MYDSAWGGVLFMKRNVLQPSTPFQQRSEIEKKATESLAKFDGDLSGTYYPLTGMDDKTQKQLTDDHFLFNDHDR
jgi:creatine kinase